MKDIERQKLLGRIEDTNSRIEISRILDKVDEVLETSEPRLTDFLDPAQQELAIAILKQVPGIRFQREGGYINAERQRCLIFPDIYPKELLDPKVTALSMTVQGKTENLTHRDWLGAIMSLGIRRDKIGDIIPLENGCQIIIADEIKTLIASNVLRVGKTTALASEIDLEALQVEPARIKEIRSTVASLRLDSVAGEGFSVSRTKMAREIKAENVKVNWSTVDNPAYMVKEGDLISMKGKGRVILESVEGETRKGRLRVSLKRFM